jgi:hypothetical protein
MNQCPVVDEQSIPICALLDDVQTIILSKQRVGWICVVKLDGWREAESVMVADDVGDRQPQDVLAEAIVLARGRKEHDGDLA